MKKIKNKKISILGIGRSGTAAALLLNKYNNKVYISDNNVNKNKFTEILGNNNIDFETGSHNIQKILDSDLVVLSPGIPDNIEILKMIKKNNIEIITELELGCRFNDKPIIAVTGTNGKTTIVSLLSELLNEVGYKPITCGNIGYAFSQAILENNEYDIVILEVSSFQLHYIKYFKPYISIISNITPDHMDRYKNFKEYAETKKNIFMNQTETEFAILNYNDKNIMNIAENIKSKKIYFNNINSYNLKNNFICYKNKQIINVNTLIIFGVHNYENVMATLVVMDILGLDEKITKQVIQKFQGVEHRIEFVKKINGVSVFNDSKATNVESVLKCLRSFNEKDKLVLILGGRDKHDDFTLLIPEINKKVLKVIITGESSEIIRKQINLNGKVIVESDFDKAVYKGFEHCTENCKFVLSPGCASFDRFDNYEHRGNYFKKLVDKIK